MHKDNNISAIIVIINIRLVDVGDVFLDRRDYDFLINDVMSLMRLRCRRQLTTFGKIFDLLYRTIIPRISLFDRTLFILQTSRFNGLQ